MRRDEQGRSGWCRVAGWSAPAVVLAAHLATPGAVQPAGAAQPAYPTKPIRIVVMSTPGSGPDIMARLIGQHFTEAWGQQVVVDTRPGASGNIGGEIAARSAPDGYTLLIATSQAAIVSAMFEKVPYHLINDFSPISLLANTPFIMVVHPSVAATSVKDLIALAKSKPGALHYGSGGSGSPPHLAAEVFKSATSTNIVHVPYKGVTQALTDTLGGQLQMTISVVPMVMPVVKAGKVRALGVTSLKRTPLAPDLPTIAETVPNYEVIGWYSLLAPARTPAPITERLNIEAVKALKTPEFQDKLTGLGAEPIGSTRDELAAFLPVQMNRMRQAIKDAGVKPD